MCVALMMVGFFTVITRSNLVKKIMGLAIFQASILLFYIAIGTIDGANAPILLNQAKGGYANPVPHVLMLTAIVVGAMGWYII